MAADNLMQSQPNTEKSIMDRLALTLQLAILVSRKGRKGERRSGAADRWLQSEKQLGEKRGTEGERDDGRKEERGRERERVERCKCKTHQKR